MAIPLYFHIREIQYRGIYLTFSFCITFCICYFYSVELLFLFVQPFFVLPENITSLEGRTGFIFTDLAEALSTTLTICGGTTFHFLLPCCWYHWWAFTIPGLFRQERKKVSHIFFFFFFLILGEGFLIFFVFLPELYTFFCSFEIQRELFTIQLEARIQPFIRFQFQIYLILLFLMQFPFLLTLIFHFTQIGAKKLTFFRKYLYFCFLIIAAFFSPPDPFYQIILGFSITVLYEFGIWVDFIYTRKNLFFSSINKIVL